MDFIPEPLASLPGVDVPLLEIIPCAVGDFQNFPQLHHFELDRLTKSGEDPVEIASFLQSWLFFGLLSEVFHKAVNIEDYTTVDPANPSKRLITAKRIAELSIPSPFSRRRNSGITSKNQSLLTTAYKVLRQAATGPFYDQLTSPFIETHLAIALLCEALQFYVLREGMRLDMHVLILQRLQDAGWCSSHIEQIKAMENYHLGYYLSRTNRPNPRGYTHKACPETHCVAANSSLAKESYSYVTAHTHDIQSPCQQVHVDQRKIIEIIANGDIPILSIQKSDDDETLKIHVKAAQSTDAFIAVSHVWSDGLGNSHFNSLPECQIRRLQHYLSELPFPTKYESRLIRKRNPSTIGLHVDFPRRRLYLGKASRSRLFWLDTLCIPAATCSEDEPLSEIKKRAINQMALIYSQASQVLVLDSMLLQSRISALDPKEILARVAFSNWMGRCWTLQEGALSHHVSFQFADGAFKILASFSYRDARPRHFRLMSFSEHITGITKNIISGRLFKDILYFPSRPTVGEQISLSITDALINASLEPSYGLGCRPSLKDFRNGKILVAAWNALVRRTTTVEKDIPAIFANILGLNGYRNMSLPEDEWLQAVIMTQKSLPIDLLYNTGPKRNSHLNHSGRWIPTSISRRKLEMDPKMQIDVDDGTVVLQIQRPQHQKRTCDPYLVIVKSCIPKGLSRCVVLVGSSRISIDYHRDPNDELDEDLYTATAFLINQDRTKACCLRIVSTTEKDIKSVYDCPCTVNVIESIEPELTCKDIFNGKLAEKSMRLTIESVLMTNVAPYSRRGHLWGFRLHRLPIIVILLVITLGLWVVSLIMRSWIVTVCFVGRKSLATDELVDCFSPLGVISMVTFPPWHLIPFLWVIPVPQVAYVASKIQSHAHWSRVSITYAASHSIFCAWCLVALLYFWLYLPKVRFQEELEILKQDWKGESAHVKNYRRIRKRIPKRLRRRTDLWFI